MHDSRTVGANDADDATEALANEVVRLRRASETLRGRLVHEAGVTLDGAAISVLFTAVRCGPQRSTDLAKRVGLDPSTMSRHVSALVSDGMMHRIPDPVDGRAVLVEATEEGRNAYHRVKSQRTGLMRQLLAEWPTEDISTMAKLLARLNDTVETLDSDGTAFSSTPPYIHARSTQGEQ